MVDRFGDIACGLEGYWDKVEWVGVGVILLGLFVVTSSRIKFSPLSDFEVVCCLVSGKCVVGICRLLQWRHGTADICRTGSMASLLVLGTIQVLPRRWIMLLLKSCLMLLSQINVVPPMAV